MARVFTVFRSRLRDEVSDEYRVLASKLEHMGRESPGFVDYRSLTAEDGEHLSVVVFETMAAQAAWRNDPEHRLAQQLARDRFYEWYEVSVCEEIRTSQWERSPGRSRVEGR